MAKKQKSEILEALEAKHGKRVAKLLYYDDNLALLDAALSAAEEELQQLLDKRFTPEEIAGAFEAHVRIHLTEELTGAKRHGNDVADYREAVNDGKDS